jgi:hypothetical protein
MKRGRYCLLIVIALSSCAPFGKAPSYAAAPTQPSASPSVPPAGVFVDEPMNLRTGPGVIFDVVGQVTPGRTYTVIGKHLDWWLIDIGGANSGWIYAPVYITNFVGDPESVPDVPSPPTPSPEPTPTCPPTPPTLPPPEVRQSEARDVLILFFALLSQGKYAQAAELYSGGYDILRDNNPLLDPRDQAALLKNACEINGYQCLLAGNVISQPSQSPYHTQFLVEFSNPDGSLFVRGPCCGASEEDMPSQSQFPYDVMLSCGGEYSVTELPPYVP